MLAVAQVGVSAQRAQEGLLKRIFCGASPEQPREVAEDSVPVLLVEVLERRNRHGGHHGL